MWTVHVWLRESGRFMYGSVNVDGSFMAPWVWTVHLWLRECGRFIYCSVSVDGSFTFVRTRDAAALLAACRLVGLSVNRNVQLQHTVASRSRSTSANSVDVTSRMPEPKHGKPQAPWFCGSFPWRRRLK